MHQPDAPETCEQHPCHRSLAAFRIQSSLINMHKKLFIVGGNTQLHSNILSTSVLSLQGTLQYRNKCTCVSPLEAQNTDTGRKSMIRMTDLEQINCVKLLMSHHLCKEPHLNRNKNFPESFSNNHNRVGGVIYEIIK